jgi:hypothetical protein
MHHTPTYSSWLNQADRWFAYLTEDLLRRGDHRSAQALERDIRDWATAWNENPKPFIWTKTAEQSSNVSADKSNESRAQDTRALPRLCPRVPQPHHLHRQMSARSRRIQAPITPSLLKSRQGILMSLHQCSAEQAFSLLTQAPQHQNRKLHDIAAEVVHHAEVPDSSPAGGRGRAIPQPLVAATEDWLSRYTWLTSKTYPGLGHNVNAEEVTDLAQLLTVHLA